MAIDASALGDPKSLAPARIAAHVAIQPLSKAARANIAARADDSHSSVLWRPGASMFVTHPFDSVSPPARVGLGLTPLRLAVLRGDTVAAELPLAATSVEAAEAWLDLQLKDLGLAPASPVAQPFSMPDDTLDLAVFPSDPSGFPELAAWFSLAQSALEAVRPETAGEVPGPSGIVAWPHHFDLAFYVALEEGDFETARGIGIGLSPGDEHYDQPYVYLYPWPRPDVSDFPDACPAPGHWSSQGFIGAAAPGEEVVKLGDPLAGTVAFLKGSYAVARRLLAA